MAIAVELGLVHTCTVKPIIVEDSQALDWRDQLNACLNQRVAFESVSCFFPALFELPASGHGVSQKLEWVDMKWSAYELGRR